MKKTIGLIAIMIIIMFQGIRAQDNLKLKYKDIKGVEKLEFFGIYGEKQMGGGLAFIEMLEGKNYWRINVNYDFFNELVEEKEKYELGVDYAWNIYRMGENLNLKFFLGGNIGYELREHLLLDKKIEFFVFGIDTGLEGEVYLMKRLALVIRGKQYIQVAESKFRLVAQAEAGFRIVIN